MCLSTTPHTHPRVLAFCRLISFLQVCEVAAWARLSRSTLSRTPTLSFFPAFVFLAWFFFLLQVLRIETGFFSAKGLQFFPQRAEYGIVCVCVNSCFQGPLSHLYSLAGGCPTPEERASGKEALQRQGRLLTYLLVQSAVPFVMFPCHTILPVKCSAGFTHFCSSDSFTFPSLSQGLIFSNVKC